MSHYITQPRNWQDVHQNEVLKRKRTKARKAARTARKITRNKNRSK